MVEGQPREELVHDEVSGRMRRKAVFNDKLEDEIGDGDDDDEDEEIQEEEIEDNDEEYSGIRFPSISDKVFISHIKNKVQWRWEVYLWVSLLRAKKMRS